jgi:hypothetical protein
MFLPTFFSPRKRIKKVLQERPEDLREQLELFRRFKRVGGQIPGGKGNEQVVTSDMLGKAFKKILSEGGIKVIKHGRQGDPHMREIYLNEKTMELAWQQVCTRLCSETKKAFEKQKEDVLIRATASPHVHQLVRVLHDCLALF